MITIKDVAREADVAVSTVSNVLTKKKYVSPQITEKVLGVCKKLNYFPSFAASILVTKKTGIIGLFLSADKEQKFDDVYPDLIKGVTLSAYNYDLKPLLYLSINKDDLLSELSFAKSPIDGAIILTPHIDDFRTHAFSDDHIPFVIIGNTFNQKQLYRVDVDNENLVYEITKNLLNLGHKKILFFNSDPKHTISFDRLDGYLKAIKNHGQSIQLSDIINSDNDGIYAANHLEELLSNELNYTAIIVPSDIVGEKIYNVLLKHKYKVGADVSIVSLGGNTRAFSLNPPLTTVLLDYEEIGKRSVELLYAQLNNIHSDKKVQFIDYKISYTPSCKEVKK